MIDVERSIEVHGYDSLAKDANEKLQKEYSRYIEQHPDGMRMIEDYVTIAQVEAVIQALIDQDTWMKEHAWLSQESEEN